MKSVKWAACKNTENGKIINQNFGTSCIGKKISSNFFLCNLAQSIIFRAFSLSFFSSSLFPLLTFWTFFINHQKEGTILLLADIFSTCYGWEPIKPIKEPVLQPVNGSRIDPKFVNNSELSDVTFRWVYPCSDVVHLQTSSTLLSDLCFFSSIIMKINVNVEQQI